MSTDDILTERLHRAEQDERRTATMSETPINIEQFRRGYAAGYRDGKLERWNKCDSLVCPYEQRALQAEAQLTEVTRERDANVTHNRKLQQQLEHRTLTLGAEVKKRESAEAALAPLRVVIEQMVKDLADGDSSDCCYGGSCISSAVEERLKKALSALPADPPPLPREA